MDGRNAQLAAGALWGIALAFAGTLLIISKGDIQVFTELRFNLGNFWSLLAAMIFAWFSIRIRFWTRTIAPLPLMVVTGWSGLLLVMLPLYLAWVMSGGPWLVWNDADIDFALAATGYMGLAPTMLGNLFYLYGVAALGPARAAAFLYLSPLFSRRVLDCLARRAIGLVSHRWNRGDLFGLVHSGQARPDDGGHAVGVGLGPRTAEVAGGLKNPRWRARLRRDRPLRARSTCSR